METSQSLAIESFSYSWLLNPKPSLHDLEGINYYLEEEQSFNFDTPIISQSSSFNISLVHYADELFSNGFIKPIDHVDDDSSIKSSDTSMPMSSSSSLSSSRSTSFSCSFFLGKLGKISLSSSKKIMQKWVGLMLKPLCRKVEVSRKSSARVDDIDRRKKLRGSTSCVGDYYYLCAHMESPIHDAVLHCKRSIGK